MNGWNMKFWKFKILEKCLGPNFSNSRKIMVLKMTTLMLQIPAQKWVWKIGQLPKPKSPLSASLLIFWHTLEDGSRKVNMNAVNFSPTPWNFWPVMSQAFRKPSCLTSIPMGNILDFQTPPALDEPSNQDPGHSQRTQGWNTSARETLAVDM